MNFVEDGRMAQDGRMEQRIEDSDFIYSYIINIYSTGSLVYS